MLSAMVAQVINARRLLVEEVSDADLSRKLRLNYSNSRESLDSKPWLRGRYGILIEVQAFQ